MKTKSYLGLVAGLSIFLFSCEDIITNKITPSGPVTRESHQISGFTGLDVSNAINATVTFSDAEEGVIIEANENVQEVIEVFRQGTELVIKLKDNTSIRGNATLKATITANSLDEFEASGASAITLLDVLYGDNVSVELSGASSFWGEVRVNTIDAELSGASFMDILGKTNEAYFEASGASTLKDYDFNINSLYIDLSGASNAHFTVHETVDVEASGASNLYFAGDAMIKKQVLSGASTVTRVD